MPSRGNRPPIPVTLMLPTQAELDAILMAVDALTGQAVRTAINQTLTPFGLPALRQRGHSGSHSASNTCSNR